MPRLTAIVPCLNEAAVIRKCLQSLRWVDELLVVDSFSTDGTPEIAQEYASRVLQHEYANPGAQKNWALGQAQGEWALFVDADEQATPGLALEIKRLLAAGAECDGYAVRRRNLFLAREIKHCGWQRDWVVRLIRNGRGRYHERELHEELRVEGKVGRLQGALIHDTGRDLSQWQRKIIRYGEWEARRQKGKPAPSGAWMAFHPLLRFLKMFVLERGFLDGTHGLALSLYTAAYVISKDTHVWQSSMNEESNR